MDSSNREKAAARRPMKLAVLAAALVVAACFGAAFTFVGEQPAKAGDPMAAANR